MPVIWAYSIYIRREVRKYREIERKGNRDRETKRQRKREKKCEAAATPVLPLLTQNGSTTSYGGNGGRTTTLGVGLVLWCSVLMKVLITAIQEDPRKKKAALLLLEKAITGDR
ncbi:hypothetical protein L2E82_30978 [Cichorium intybus]|uniref:Uncharacterized protein n=1 Tax=Cichorium intybus TaxID=13427 RepID=A0ACB9D1Q3_CICIN|nr:hypothetical protein L2E82_30978 [Cichorium intybus]